MQQENIFLKTKLKFSQWWSHIRWPFLLNTFWITLVFSTITGIAIYSFISGSNAIAKNLATFDYILAIIGVSVFLIAYAFLMVVAVLAMNYSDAHIKEKLFYSLLSLNFVYFAYLIHRIYKLKLLSFKVQRWKIFDITLMGLILGLFLVLKFVDSIIPKIPLIFLDFSIHYLCLAFLCFLTGSFLKTFLVGLIGGIMTLVFPDTIILNAAQFIFDYIVPNLVFSLSFFIVFKISERKTALQRIQFAVFIFIPFSLVYLSHVISGVMFWTNGAWPGISLFLYSFILNAPNSGFDLIVGLILGPIIFSRLMFLKEHYQQRLTQ